MRCVRLYIIIPCLIRMQVQWTKLARLYICLQEI